MGNEETFKCYGCMSEKPLSEMSNHFVRVICVETKEIMINPVCKICREKFLKMDGNQERFCADGKQKEENQNAKDD